MFQQPIESLESRQMMSVVPTFNFAAVNPGYVAPSAATTVSAVSQVSTIPTFNFAAVNPTYVAPAASPTPTPAPTSSVPTFNFGAVNPGYTAPAVTTPYRPGVVTVADLAKITPYLSPTYVQNGTLFINATDNADQITVNNAGATYDVTLNGKLSQFAVGSVQRIEVQGNAGNDAITINGNVTIQARVYAGAGNDTVNGGGGNDFLYGENDNDVLRGGLGADYMSGGLGWDTVTYDEKLAGVNVSLDGAYNDGVRAKVIPISVALGGAGGQYITTPAEGDNALYDIEAVRGSGYADNLSGNNSANAFYGLGGADKINAWSGNDSLFGGAGNDSLYGEGDNDSLWGEAGADVLSGGLGWDDARYDEDNAARTGSVFATIDGVANDGYTGELDNVLTDNEVLWGASGRDVLRGNDSNNMLFGLKGDDLLDGKGGNDSLFGWDGTDNLLGGEGHDLLRGEGARDFIYGGNGNDSAYGGDGDDDIRGDAGDDLLDGENGNDRIYAGYGADNVFGGNNDDVLVAVGGGIDRLTGGAGYDSFWGDAPIAGLPIFGGGAPGDTFVDADLNEIITRSVHKIGNFVNQTMPKLTANGFVGAPVSKDPNGQDLPDPLLNRAAAGTQWRNFRSNPLYNLGAPTINDVNQGTVGDCWFLSTLAGAARLNTNIIKQSITDLGDGTYAVRFKDQTGGGESYVRVDADLPTDSAGNLLYGGLGQGRSTWVALMEKAYTWVRGGNAQVAQSYYGVIDGGHTFEAATALGLTTHAVSQKFASANAMGQWISEQAGLGRMMTFSTTKTPAMQMVASHAYTVVGAYQSGGTWQVIVRNPWGTDGGSGYSDANANDGWLTLPASTLMASMRQIIAFK